MLDPTKQKFHTAGLLKLTLNDPIQMLVLENMRGKTRLLCTLFRYAYFPTKQYAKSSKKIYKYPDYPILPFVSDGHFTVP